MTIEDLISAKGLPDQTLYHPKEAAALLGVSQSTINAWCREGRLDGFKAGKHWKHVTRASIKTFVEGGSNV